MKMPSDKCAKVDEYKAALFEAVKQDETEPVQSFLDEPKLILSQVKNERKQNLFHVACMEGAEQVLDMMMGYPKVMKKLHSKDRSSRNALHLAAAMGRSEVCRRLIKAKAKLDSQDKKGQTALLLAVRFEWVDTVKLLVETGANPMIADGRGDCAVDVANEKADGACAKALANFVNSKRQTSTFTQMKKKVFPRSKPRAGPHPALFGDSSDDDDDDSEDEENQSPTRRDNGAGTGLDLTLANALEEAVSATVKGQGPVVDLTSPPKKASKEDAKSPAKRKDSNKSLDEATASPVSASSPVEEKSWWRRAVAEHKPTDTKAAVATAYAGAPQKKSAPADIDAFALSFFFDEKVKRLEFEVEWQERQPLAGNVKSGGAAESRGLLRGDVIEEIAGVQTEGRGRDELLPQMKTRPLRLIVSREARVSHELTPHAEFPLTFAGQPFKDVGVEVKCIGVPVVTAVRANSKAWAAGVLPGDAVAQVNGKDTMKASKADVMSSLESASKVVVWRRPLGTPLNAPWSGDSE